MKIWINSVEKEIFLKNVKVRFNNILDGFNNYENCNLEPKNKAEFMLSENGFIKFLEDSYKLNNGVNGCYVEIYFKKLDEEAFSKLLEGLDEADVDKIKEIKRYIIENGKRDNIYFRVIDIGILSVLTKMCTRELFFITFYFTQVPITIWGNYNLCFPVFYINKEDLYMYRKIISASNLLIK